MPLNEYQNWLRQVDRELERTVSLSMLDLPDFNYTDAFNDETTPKEVADAVLKEAGYEPDE